MANTNKQEMQLMDEHVDRTVMHWIRLILARQPDAEFAFIATKEDLLGENSVTAQLFKKALKAQLAQVDTKVQQMIRKLTTKEELDENVLTRAYNPNVVFVSCVSSASVQAARSRVKTLIVKSERGFHMPDAYTQALNTIVKIRAEARANDVSGRILRVFAPADRLTQELAIEAHRCRLILQTLHDLGDVLWYEDLGVELLQNTVILDPLLLIDFIREVINHKHPGQVLSHVDLKARRYWMGLSAQEHMKAMKQVLQKFHLVYAADDDRVMRWDSDLIVPAYWQTKTPASWLFLGDILRLNETKVRGKGVDWEYHFAKRHAQSREGETVRVNWEYHFEFGLPSTLFDHLVVASVSPYFQFDAGPDWILYKENDIAACRIMVGRDLQSLHRTIHIEAVVAEEANAEQVEQLWDVFQQLCGAFISVLRKYPGLAVSSIALDDKQRKIGLGRLMTSALPSRARTWMPPLKTWEWFKKLARAQQGSYRLRE